jgi:hypothetical protein
MRRGEFLLTMALLTITTSLAKGNPSGIPRADVAGAPKPPAKTESSSTAAPNSPAPQSIARDKTLGAAYFHTLSILNSSNECSDFFGGPVNSATVFNQLFARVQKEHVRAAIGIQMSGRITNVWDTATETRYRLFDKVIINADGPFYRKQFIDVRFQGVGTFDPNTNEARVLMLLHELGHAMKGDDGDWLLPNDGKDDTLSRLNSQRIEAVCGKQISLLAKDGHAAEFSLAGKTERSAGQLKPRRGLLPNAGTRHY